MWGQLLIDFTGAVRTALVVVHRPLLRRCSRLQRTPPRERPSESAWEQPPVKFLCFHLRTLFLCTIVQDVVCRGSLLRLLSQWRHNNAPIGRFCDTNHRSMSAASSVGSVSKQSSIAYSSVSPSVSLSSFRLHSSVEVHSPRFVAFTCSFIKNINRIT